MIKKLMSLSELRYPTMTKTENDLQHVHLDDLLLSKEIFEQHNLGILDFVIGIF